MTTRVRADKSRPRTSPAAAPLSSSLASSAAPPVARRESLPLAPIVPRSAGERCCDDDALPQRTLAEAQRATADLDILAHPVRLQLLDVLVRKEGEVCVCDLEAAVPVKQPTVSHHLRLLREAELVTSERRAQWAYYRVNRPALDALRSRLAAELARLG